MPAKPPWPPTASKSGISKHYPPNTTTEIATTTTPTTRTAYKCWMIDPVAILPTTARWTQPLGLVATTTLPINDSCWAKLNFIIASLSACVEYNHSQAPIQIHTGNHQYTIFQSWKHREPLIAHNIHIPLTTLSSDLKFTPTSRRHNGHTNLLLRDIPNQGSELMHFCRVFSQSVALSSTTEHAANIQTHSYPISRGDLSIKQNSKEY